MMSDSHKYDIAVSFAGEQREYVRQTVEACKARGLSVMFDEDKTNEWWGQNFLREQRQAYSSNTRFFVPFLSTEYMAKPIPMDEFASAMMTAVKQGDGYILPVIMGGAEVPPDLLHPHIGYLRAENYTPEQLANELVQKVNGAAQSGQSELNVGTVVGNALRVQLPKITPSTYSKYDELDRLFELLVTHFTQGASDLRTSGFMCNIKANDEAIVVRVEYGGETVAGLNVTKGGGGLGDDRVTWLEGYRNIGGNSFNGWATPKYDKERSQCVVEVSDLNLFSTGDFDGSYEQFFDLLWSKIVRQIETAVR